MLAMVGPIPFAKLPRVMDKPFTAPLLDADTELLINKNDEVKASTPQQVRIVIAISRIIHKRIGFVDVNIEMRGNKNVRGVTNPIPIWKDFKIPILFETFG